MRWPMRCSIYCTVATVCIIQVACESTVESLEQGLHERVAPGDAAIRSGQGVPISILDEVTAADSAIGKMPQMIRDARQSRDDAMKAAKEAHNAVHGLQGAMDRAYAVFDSFEDKGLKPAQHHGSTKTDNHKSHLDSQPKAGGSKVNQKLRKKLQQISDPIHSKLEEHTQAQEAIRIANQEQDNDNVKQLFQKPGYTLENKAVQKANEVTNRIFQKKVSLQKALNGEHNFVTFDLPPKSKGPKSVKKGTSLIGKVKTTNGKHGT